MEKRYYFRIANEKGLRYTMEVSVELKEGKDGVHFVDGSILEQPVFTSSLSVGNGRRYLMGGQCFDEIIEKYTFVTPADKEIFMEIYDLWTRNHLNNLNAGTPKQMEALKNGFDDWCSERGIDPIWERYNLQCEYLRTLDLYEDKEYLVDGQPYRYGSLWIYRPISEDDLKRINAVLK